MAQSLESGCQNNLQMCLCRNILTTQFVDAASVVVKTPVTVFRYSRDGDHLICLKTCRPESSIGGIDPSHSLSGSRCPTHPPWGIGIRLFRKGSFTSTVGPWPAGRVGLLLTSLFPLRSRHPCIRWHPWMVSFTSAPFSWCLRFCP